MSEENLRPATGAARPAQAASRAQPAARRDAAPVPASAPSAAPAPVGAPPQPGARLQRTRTRIKICGITTVEMALAAVNAGADAIGIVFAPGSPRHVLPGLAAQINKSLPPMVSGVGVFRNPADPDVFNWRGEWVQLHGSEEEPQVARIAQQHRRIIKGIAFDATQIVRWDQSPHVSALLIDSSNPGGGSAFDHEALAQLMPALRTPVILAGGLTPNNVEQAIRTVRPYGVDVSSGVEMSRGVKDAGLIRAFCDAVRTADQAAV
jgi:phosphoribosylanthranilate isomerase